MFKRADDYRVCILQSRKQAPPNGGAGLHVAGLRDLQYSCPLNGYAARFANNVIDPYPINLLLKKANPIVLSGCPLNVHTIGVCTLLIVCVLY